MKYPDDFINKVINGDCMEVMPLIPSKSINLILCDLPYGVTSRNKWDEIIPIIPLWNEYKRLIKDNGLVVLTSWGMFSAKLIVSATIKYQYSMVWCKPNHTNQLNAKKQPLRKHEDILVFYDNQPTYNPQGLIKKDSITKQGKTSTLNYGEQDRDPYFQEWTNYPTTLVYTKTTTTKSHPTEKPLELFEYLIRTYTNEGDLILDNCVGSGTTSVASIKTNRNFIVIEKEKQYYDICIKRIEEQRGKEVKEDNIFTI
jgi:site-specific DNA-methyltransferase (adenine-specific)